MDQDTFAMLRNQACRDLTLTVPEVTPDTSQAAALKLRCVPTASQPFLAAVLFQFTQDSAAIG